ncbi:MAG: hypothetical protein IPN94_23890 [Sphingobacteriales bacterium]|nr:hypothetical protein [Sphingobacteriales bacterium]
MPDTLIGNVPSTQTMSAPASAEAGGSTVNTAATRSLIQPVAKLVICA